MSESPAGQGDSGLSQGPNPATLLPFHDPAFTAPSHNDVRAVTQRYSLTGSALARVTGVTPRTVRKWLAPPEVENHAPMPYAAWRLLLIEAGIVKPLGIPHSTSELQTRT
jgi:hypothetical protein